MNRLLIYMVLALQLAGLTGFYAWHANLPEPRYLLRTRPVDPRDLLRGDYVILAYDISTPPPGHEPGEDGSTVFVRLKPDGPFWVADYVSDVAQADGSPWLKARWKGRGVNQYFVPEGRGNPPGKISVEIAIRKDGAAQIVQLYNDDQPWAVPSDK
jgi:uncharacterized membrane-anchored protein